MEKEIKNEFNILGKMLKNSFDDVDKRFDRVDERFDGVDKRLKNLEIGQEDIRLRLDNTASQFDFDDLNSRVNVLEKKVL